jgi:hypothetical protein
VTPKHGPQQGNGAQVNADDGRLAVGDHLETCLSIQWCANEMQHRIWVPYRLMVFADVSKMSSMGPARNGARYEGEAGTARAN